MMDREEIISVGARDSVLAKVQVEEVLKELQVTSSHVRFAPTYLKSTGDLNQEQSLRDKHRSLSPLQRKNATE